MESAQQVFADAGLTPEEIQAMPAYIEGDEDFYGTTAFEKLFQYYSTSGDMPYGVMKARDGDPDVWILDELESLGLSENRKFKKIVVEELGMMNGNGSANGLPQAWAQRVQQDYEVHLELEEDDAYESLVELGKFLAKLSNEGYDDLAAELDQIIVKMQAAGLTQGHVQEGLDEAQWGGFTGGAAPLDEPTGAQGDMSYEEQLKVFELMMDGGDHDPLELLNHPENIQNGLSFPDLQEDDVEDILSKLGMPEMNDPKWQRNIVGQSAVSEGPDEGKRARDAMYQIGTIVEKIQEENRGNLDTKLHGSLVEILKLVAAYVDGQETTGLNEAPIDPFMVRYVELAKEMVSNGVKEQKIDPQLADEILSMLAGVEGTGGFGEVSELFGGKKKTAPMSTADTLEKAVQLMTRESECFKEGNGLSYVIWGLNDDPFDKELFELGRKFTTRLKEVANQFRSEEDSKLTAQEDSLMEMVKEELGKMAKAPKKD